MQTSDQPLASFAYRAQTGDGSAISGSIDAADVEQAKRHLESLHVRVIEIAPAQKQPKPRPLRGDDFIAFNQQLGHLTAAGMPMEHGLRLIAEDMRSGRLAQTIKQIAAELEAGQSLSQVFEKHQGRFPSMYGRLLEAGVKSNNLSAMLFNLARHLELVRRLRAMLWRVAAYPVMVLAGLACVLFFLGFYVLPGFEEVFKSFKVSLPDATRLLLSVSLVLPALLVAFVVVVVAFPIAAFMLRKTGLDRTLLDALILPLPLIGPVFRKSLLAAWCDAVRMAVEAGLDLPAAIQLAGDATASPKLRADGLALIASLSAGQDLGIAPRGAVLPPTVVAGMSLGMQHHDLASTLKSLSDMYHQQAELRLNALPGILTPILVIGVAVLIGFVVVALVTPLISLIGAVSGK